MSELSALTIQSIQEKEMPLSFAEVVCILPLFGEISGSSINNLARFAVSMRRYCTCRVLNAAYLLRCVSHVVSRVVCTT